MPPIERRFDDPAEKACNDARRVPQPRACFTEPVRLRVPQEKHDFSLTYIKATADARPVQGPRRTASAHSLVACHFHAGVVVTRPWEVHLKTAVATQSLAHLA